MGLVGKVGKLYRNRGVQQTVVAVIRELYAQFVLKTLKQRYVNRTIYDRQMTLDLEDRGISRALWLFGRRELDHKWMLEKTLKPRQKMLDIGANIGYYVLLEHGLVGTSGTIIAVEPSQTNLDLLEKNLKLNGIDNVEVVRGAVSNFSGTGTFWLARESNLNTFHKAFLDEKSGAVEAIDVEVFSVRDIVDRYGPIDYVRMDIEGHEVEVLGEIAILAEETQIKPATIFETHTRAYSSDHDIAPVISHLYELGYEAKYVSSSTEKGSEILESWGLPAVNRIRTDDVVRTIHQNVPEEVLHSCFKDTGGIRTVYLEAL